VDAVEHGVLCPELQGRSEECRVFNPQASISGSDIWRNQIFLTLSSGAVRRATLQSSAKLEISNLKPYCFKKRR
jgi:hypothetical protein